MSRQQTRFWTVEDCHVRTITETVGRLSQAEVAKAEVDPWQGDWYLTLGGTPVKYVATPCPYGGGRFWFLCPSCGRRVFKLYAPPPGEVYACWRCHDLTWESRRRGHGIVALLFRGLKATLKLETLLQRRGRKPRRFYRLFAELQERGAALTVLLRTLKDRR